MHKIKVLLILALLVALVSACASPPDQTSELDQGQQIPSTNQTPTDQETPPAPTSNAGDLGQTMLKSVAAIHPSPVGISFTTLAEIKDGNSFLDSGCEYRNFINTGKLLYGEDIKSLLPVPTRKQEENSAMFS